MAKENLGCIAEHPDVRANFACDLRFEIIDLSAASAGEGGFFVNKSEKFKVGVELSVDVNIKFE